MSQTVHEATTKIVENLKLKGEYGAKKGWSAVKGTHAKRKVENALIDKKDADKSLDTRRAERAELVKNTTEDRAHARALMDQTVPMLLECVTDAADALGALEKYDIVAATASGQRVLASRAKLLAKVAWFDEQDFDSLNRAVQALSEASDPDVAINMSITDLQRYADTLRARMTTVSGSLGGLVSDAREYGADARKMFNDQMFKVWVKDNPDMATTLLLEANQGIDQALDKGSAAAGPYKPAVDAFAAVKKVVLNRQIEATIFKAQVGREKKKHAEGYGFEILKGNPAYPAKRIAQKRKADFAQLLEVLGLAGKQAPPGVWSTVSGILQKAANVYFDRPWKELEDKLGVNADEQDLSAKMEDKAKKEAKDLLSQVPGKAMELVKGGNFVEMLNKAAEGIPGYVQDQITTALVNWAIKKIVKKFPIDPAQEVDLDGLLDDFDKIQKALTPNREKYGLSEDVEDVKQQLPGKATETADGRKVLRYLQSGIENDSRGPFEWVEVEDPNEGVLMGKLRFSQDPKKRTFKAVESSARSMLFPTEDKFGNPIDETYFKVPDGWEVREGDLRGLLNIEKVFIPQKPARMADWSGRSAQIDEIEDGSRKRKGRWFRMSGPQGYMYFEYEDGAPREWAAGTSIDKSGYTFAEKFKDKKKVKEMDIAKVQPYRAASVA